MDGHFDRSPYTRRFNPRPNVNVIATMQHNIHSPPALDNFDQALQPDVHQPQELIPPSMAAIAADWSPQHNAEVINQAPAAAAPILAAIPAPAPILAATPANSVAQASHPLVDVAIGLRLRAAGDLLEAQFGGIIDWNSQNEEGPHITGPPEPPARHQRLFTCAIQ